MSETRCNCLSISPKPPCPVHDAPTETVEQEDEITRLRARVEELEELEEPFASNDTDSEVVRLLDEGGFYFGYTEDGTVGVFAMAGTDPAIGVGDTAWEALLSFARTLTDQEEDDG